MKKKYISPKSKNINLSVRTMMAQTSPYSIQRRTLNTTGVMMLNHDDDEYCADEDYYGEFN